MPNIKISDHVKTELDNIKKTEEHTSYDSAIRALLREYNTNNQ